jgi:hypothetical protein
MPKTERRALTSKSFAHVEIGSAWINQTIRNANARTKVKQFRCLPLETNNQNWTLHKVSDTYSVSFGLLRGIKKRVPLAVHHATHQAWLDAILDGAAKAGSIKLWCSRKGIWYACLSVSMEVPDEEKTGRWIGIDRGQNVPRNGRQRKATKADAGKNRDYWPFLQLEQFIIYKAQLAGVAVEKVPAAYTSKSCHRCGALGSRKKHAFSCPRCTYHAHSDANAAMNIRDWYGWCCPLVLQAPVDGAHDLPLNTVREAGWLSAGRGPRT